MNVVCGTDFSPAAGKASVIAAGLARRLGVDLYLVHVLRLPAMGSIGGEIITLPVPGFAFGRNARSHADEMLERESARLRETGATVVPLLSMGDPASEIVDVAEQDDAPLIVSGSHERGAGGRFLLGSIGDALLKRSPAPILVVRGDATELTRWATDGAGTVLDATIALDRADGLSHLAGLARVFSMAGDVNFHYAHVIEGVHASEEIYADGSVAPAGEDPSEQMREIIRRAELPPPTDRIHLLAGKPAAELARFLGRVKPGVTLLGTAGGSRARLGSVAQAVLHAAVCPVAIAPGVRRR